MKKIVLVFGLLVASSVLFAGVEKNPNSTTEMAVLKNGNVVKVHYSGEKERNVRITIYNNKRQAVFQEEVKGHAAFIRPYNLVVLPKGEYIIELNDGNEVYEESINFYKAKSEVLSSIVKSAPDKFMLTLYSAQETSVKILLRDESSNILFSDRIRLKGGSAKLFNLKNIDSAVSVDLISEGSQKSIALK